MIGKTRTEMDFKENTLYVGDCLDILKYWYYNERLSNMIDLIYIDPPFNSKKNYNIITTPYDIQLQEKAFEDVWTLINYSDALEEIRKMNYINLYLFLTGLQKSLPNESYIAYLANMAVRVIYMKEMLKDTGSFYYHCDPTMSHYIKIMLDLIFGMKNFRNEIAWCYKTGGVSKEYFPWKHDNIFFYTKTNKYTFNPQKELKTSAEMKRAQEIHPEEFFDDNDEKGIYTWYYRPGHKKYPNGLKQYLEAYVRDYWLIPALTNTESERLGYPTQKPEKLIERIIKTSSNEGDLVGDFDMGGGTTPTVSQKNGRNYIGVDINLRALQISYNRLVNTGLRPKPSISGIPASTIQLKQYLHKTPPSKGGFLLEDLVIKVYLSNLAMQKYGINIVAKNKNQPGYDGEFIWNYNSTVMRGLVQVTSMHGYQHFGSFCNMVKYQKADVGVYITFENNITKRMRIQANSSKKLGNYKSIQILSIEDLLDRKQIFEIHAALKF